MPPGAEEREHSQRLPHSVQQETISIASLLDGVRLLLTLEPPFPCWWCVQCLVLRPTFHTGTQQRIGMCSSHCNIMLMHRHAFDVFNTTLKLHCEIISSCVKTCIFSSAAACKLFPALKWTRFFINMKLNLKMVTRRNANSVIFTQSREVNIISKESKQT